MGSHTGVPWHCASAWRELQAPYSDVVRHIDVGVVVEVGVHYGYSLFTFAADYPNASVFGIDDFSYDDSDKAREHLETHLSTFPNVKVIEATSHDARELWRNPRNYLDIDLLHIDGDHTYEGVKNDFELWESVVRPGGVILFHDIDSFDEVRKFFEEIEGGYKRELNLGPGLGFWFKDA